MVDRVKPRFMVHGYFHGSVHGSVHSLVHGLVHDFRPMVYGVLSNVLLEHGGLPCLFPSDVHLDYGHQASI